ncbi:MAG: hypothetical protein ACK4RZ_10710, partial [Paracoccaceae bacterium]
LPGQVRDETPWSAKSKVCAQQKTVVPLQTVCDQIGQSFFCGPTGGKISSGAAVLRCLGQPDRIFALFGASCR